MNKLTLSKCIHNVLEYEYIGDSVMLMEVSSGVVIGKITTQGITYVDINDAIRELYPNVIKELQSDIYIVEFKALIAGDDGKRYSGENIVW